MYERDPVYPGGEGDVAVVRALFGAFAARDVDGCLAVLHPDVELWPQPTAELADRGEPYRGHDGFRAYLADVDRVWAEFAVDPGDERAAAGGVICFGAAEGVTRAGGERRRVPVIWVFRLREGKIVLCRIARTAAHARSLVGAA